MTIIKRTIATIIATVAFAAAAWANCSYHTYTYSNGRMVQCSTCCYLGNCTTNCN